jgi:hypothetical protein
MTPTAGEQTYENTLPIRWGDYPRPLACSYAEIRQLHDATIVIYFPHGLGDWVMFNNIARFFTCNNNKIYITRFGDDYVSLQDGSPYLHPVYTGINNVHCNDGADYARHHFHFHLPDSPIKTTVAMAEKLREIKCTHICFSGFPEVGGGSRGPLFHSKPRAIMRALYSQLTAAEQDALRRPLSSAVNTHANSFITALVATSLRNFTPYDANTKLVVITRYGLTSIGKNWGHLFRSGKYPNEGDECREFIAICRRKNPNTIFVSMEHEGVVGASSLVDHANNVFSFSELFNNKKFGNFSAPFTAVLAALLRLTDIHVGCPTGASGVATLFPNVRNILLWLELFPSWYFEPTNNTLNVISKNQLERRRNQPGSFDAAGEIIYKNVYTDTENITGEAVFNLIEDVL